MNIKNIYAQCDFRVTGAAAVDHAFPLRKERPDIKNIYAQCDFRVTGAAAVDHAFPLRKTSR